MSASPEQTALDELYRCQSSFEHTCRYLRVLDERSKLVPFRLRPSQSQLLQIVREDQFVILLKSRKLGASTFLAAWLFWQAYFFPHRRVVVAAHVDHAASTLFNIYRTFWECLPKFMRWTTEKDNGHELKWLEPEWAAGTGTRWPFGYKSSVVVGTSNSDKFRSDTTHAVHASEVAFWNDYAKASASVFSTAVDSAPIYVETTACGMNHFHTLWYQENDAFRRVFQPWTIDPNHESKWPLPAVLRPEERAYIAEHKLTKGQARWFVRTLRSKYAGNLDIWNQEQPITADLAFVASGSRYFPYYYPDAHSHPMVTSGRVGWVTYSEPSETGLYVMGVDTAGGSMREETDFHAAVILDVTRKEEQERGCITDAAVCQWKGPVPEWAKQVLAWAWKYHALLVVEVNSYGEVVLEEAIRQAYPYVYLRQGYDHIGSQYTELLGWQTTPKSKPGLLARAHAMMASRQLEVEDPRLQMEINVYEHQLTTSGQQTSGAPAGKHDDLVLALCLAAQGMDQVHSYEEARMLERPPRNNEEILSWEQKHNKLWPGQGGSWNPPDVVGHLEKGAPWQR